MTILVPAAWMVAMVRSTSALAPCDAGDLQRVLDVRERGAAEHHRPLEHHRLTAALAGLLRGRPLDAPRRRPEQAVAKAHEHALSGAVRAEDHRARSGLEHERDA